MPYLNITFQAEKLMSENLKVAVIGTGIMGGFHATNYVALKGVDFVGVYDINQEAAKNLAERIGCKAFSSYEEVMNEVDAVSIAATSVAHAEIGLKFLNKGIHCLIEKPLATTPEDCEKLIKAAKDNNAILMVGHVERFNPAIIELSKILEKDTDVKAISARRMSAASGRITDVDVAMDLMIHDVEVIMSLVKSNVKSVKASAVKTDNAGKDYITALIEFENGVLADATASRITSNRIRTLGVTTDSAYIEADYINQKLFVHNQGRNPLMHGGLPEWMSYGVEVSTERLFIRNDQPLGLELAHFVDCVKNNVTPKTTGESAYEALKVIWAIQKELGL